MIRIFAEIYSKLHRIMIVVGTIVLTGVGGILGYAYGYKIDNIAYMLFKWHVDIEPTKISLAGAIIGLIVAFAFFGREAMILETYETSKNAEKILRLK